MSLTLIHGPVILLIYFKYCLMDEHHAKYSGTVRHCEWPHTIYRSLWPTFHGSVILTYLEHYLMDSHHTMDNGSVWHCKWPHTIYRPLWPIFVDLLILLYITVRLPLGALPCLLTTLVLGLLLKSNGSLSGKRSCHFHFCFPSQLDHPLKERISCLRL